MLPPAQQIIADPPDGAGDDPEEELRTSVHALNILSSSSSSSSSYLV